MTTCPIIYFLFYKCSCAINDNRGCLKSETASKAYIKYNYFDKDQKNKTITSSPSNSKLSKLRFKVHQLLNTKRGVKLRKQRCHDVEPVFAQIKHNWVSIIGLNTTKDLPHTKYLILDCSTLPHNNKYLFQNYHTKGFVRQR
ncbi:transposase [Chryseobacterium oranimense]|uniref:transposase n=1 Tax=Chryseobacterium oranimense TaxID=421058 RepID=UPI00391825CD